MALGSAEAVAENSGPSLMFIILPGVFDQMGSMAGIIGFIFFLLVLFAALTSAISLMEALVSIVADFTNWSRRNSLIAVMLWIIGVGILINAGYNGLSFLQPLGEGSSLLDLADFVSNSVLMPIVAFLTLVFVGWIIKPQVLIDEIKQSSPFKAEKLWVVMIKFVCPVLVAIIFVAYVGAQFGFFSF
jgi:NSS family neurotransmitter:Na+ symporter